MSKEREPQIHEGNAFNKDFIAMTMPLFAMATFLYGPRVLVLAIIAVVTAKLTDRFAAMLRGRKYEPTENLSVAVALIIVLMLPATTRFRIVVAAVLVAILVGKEAFGGYNSYPFNPAAVGYCVVAVSWSSEVFRYPEPINWTGINDWSFQNLWHLFRFEGATLVEGPSQMLKNGGLPTIENWNLLLGNYAGPLGVTATLVILSCAVYLWVKKRLPLAAPACFLATIAVLVFFFPRAPQGSLQVWPWLNWDIRLQALKHEMLSGEIVFAAVFLIDEPCTLPKNTASRAVYGVLLGVAALMFRYFGTFELGTCFALLLINAVSGYFDRAMAARAAAKNAKRKGASQA